MVEEAKRVGHQSREEAERMGRKYQFQAEKMGQQFHRAAQTGFTAALSSWSELNQGWTEMAAEINEYSKNVFNDATRVMEQLVGAKTLEDVVSIQSRYAKQAYDNHVAEVSKLGKIWADLVQNAYRPVEQARRDVV
jgi:hypothetical protein